MRNNIPTTARKPPSIDERFNKVLMPNTPVIL
jgi:hypothetical protein